VGDQEYGWAAADAAVAHVFLGSLPDDAVVDGADGHHLQRVRRLRVGERVTAADGTGAWRPYSVVDVAPARLGLRAAGTARREPDVAPRLSVAIALTKGGALEQVAAALTELGVHRIEPLQTERTVVRWDAARAQAAVDRLRTVAREAAMQARRATVPEVRPVAPLPSLAGRAGLVIADRAGAPASQVASPAGGEWVVVVGPEGGLSPSELASLPGAAFVAVGRHVLRAQTAPLAVVAALAERTTPVPDVVN
jgi:16S rRNA (uracil1498-N3)-methyltransferase